MKTPEICASALTAWKLSADGTQLLAGGLALRDNEIYSVMGEVDPSTDKTRNHVEHLPSRVTALLPLGNGQRVAAIYSLGEAVIWDRSTKAIKVCIRSSGTGGS